ncbi:MAG TPA: GDSL-type esterase/lipase family protein [Negativicutes bacterium]|nr:GDSL-type esterase/lipase family protein [Negativicutes bacterium]
MRKTIVLWVIIGLLLLQGEALAEPSVANPLAAKEVTSQPVLQWTGFPDAVMYELDIAKTADFAANQIVFHSTTVYSAGFQPDLTAWLGKTLFYRVRPLDYEKKPLSEWATAVAIDVKTPHSYQNFRPVTTTHWSQVTPILYPVYAWIPVRGADRYKVELYQATGVGAASERQYKLVQTWEAKGSLTSDFYDDNPRIGTFAWRVQAVTQNGQPIGQFSDREEFTLRPIPRQFALGVFGDSIMHGGGAISNAPSDFTYSLHAYLKTPALNLARSGDTSATSLERFERDVVPFSPRMLIILTGTNSLRGGAKADEVASELAEIARKCRRNKIVPVFLTLPPINPDRIQKTFHEPSAPGWQVEMQKVNRYILENLPHLDVAPLFVDSNGVIPPYWATDGLHPDAKAKKAIGKLINQADLTVFK